MASVVRSERAYGLAPPAYQLPDLTRVGAVYLQVADLQRSVDYYEQVIGLRLVERTTDAAALGAGSSGEPLVFLHARRGTRPVPPRGAFGLFHFALLLPSRSDLGRFASHIMRTGRAVGMSHHLVSESIYLSDPDGLGIEVYADRPPSTWRHHDRELTMSTEPLDVQDLIRESGGREWDAAPDRTTMGHVHLHVGDLDLAERFFHVALGFDETVWHYPGARFFAAGGYHHHLGTNTWSPGPAAAEDQARLLWWELILPSTDDAAQAAGSLQRAGFAARDTGEGWKTADPWGTGLRIVGER
jgi:catechol 2,3-dioxygenase